MAQISQENSWANCTQVLTIDRNRLVERLGSADVSHMAAVSRALRDTLDLG